MENQFDAIVVGGGVSGLTAAFLLTRRDQRVAMLAPGTPGGMLLTRHQGDFTLEQGPNVLLEKPEMRQLIDQLGMRDQVVYPRDENYKQFIWHSGRAWRVPRSPLPFLTSGLFSLKEKIRILRTLFRPGLLKPHAEDESVLTFFSRGLGEHVVRRVLDPVLKGIYGGQVGNLSAAALFPQLWDAMVRKLSLAGFMRERRLRGIVKPRTFVFRHGMQSLGDALLRASGEHLQHFSTVARSVSFAPNWFRVVDEAGNAYSAPQLVLALPLRLAAPLLQGATPSAVVSPLLAQITQRRYAPLSVIHCATSHAPTFSPNSFGVLFPEGTRDFFLGAMFNSELFPHLAPAGQHLLTLCFGGMAAEANEEALKPSDRIVREICAEFLGVPEITILARHHWESAIPQYDMGHRQLESELRACEKHFPGLLFAGSDRGGVGVSDRVKSVMELLRHE